MLFLSKGSMFIKYFIAPLLVFSSLLTIAQTPIKVALIGNSTVTADKGWGGRLPSKFQNHITILNSAVGGRSSKSWYDEGRLPAVLAENPDYIFIEFGHNDQPGKGIERETDPETTFQDYLKIYIDAAKSIGATPVIISPVTRRYFGSDGKIDTTWSGYLDDYADGAKAIATAENVAFINLFYLSVAHHNEIGETASMTYNGPTDPDDITHFNTTGAKAITNLIVEEIEAVLPNLAEHLLTNSYDNICSPVGWCEYNGNTTGGAEGDTVWVYTFDSLKAHAEDNLAKVIILNGSVGTGGGANSRIYINSNKTILGNAASAELHGSFKIKNVTNVIVRNIKVRGDGAHDADGEDAIEVYNSTRVWLDHLDVVDGGDGNLDVRKASNFVTISWCKFSYTSNSTAHKFSNLIGSSDSDTGDRGKLKVTLHHNYWAEGVSQRMPRARFGQIHVVNNYYRSTGNDYCIGAGYEADLLIENNVFEVTDNPIKYIGGAATAAELKNNLFVNVTGNKTGQGTAFTPPYPYTMTPVEDVENVVRFTAGRRDLNDIICGSTITTDCNGILNGTAYTDSCGVCVEGNTSLLPCSGFVEAETACSVDGVQLESSNSGYSGAGYVNTTNSLSASVTWILNKDGSSNSTFTFRFANGGASARSADILVNGSNVGSLILSVTGDWTTWKKETISIPLNDGSNEVKLVASAEDGLANIDWLSYSAGVSHAGCVITSTEDKLKLVKKKIYPNPVSSVLKLNLFVEHYKVFNAAGHEVLNGTGKNINVRGLPSGLYFLKTSEDYSVKFIKE